jgi:hypothetical protein
VPLQSSGFFRRNYGGTLFACQFDQTDKHDNACLRGLREDGGHVGAFAAVPGVRERGVLRFIEEQARDEAFSRDETSADAVD